MIDYEELLKKYIRHVVECEGVDFIIHGSTAWSKNDFSDEEWAELERLAKVGT